MPSFIQFKKIGKTYEALAGPVQALTDIELEINAGDHVVVTGKSGSGKSTLLNVLAGIDRPNEGQIIIGDTSLNALNEKALALWRGRHIGIVFQFYHLFPTLTALDNILFAMEVVNTIPKKGRVPRAQSLLEQVGLGDKGTKFPNELSGGEQQRVAIARALANDPPILIADEPTGNLDTATSTQIKQLFRAFHQNGKTIIIVTHEQIDRQDYDRVIELVDGRIHQNQTHS